jgi:hypothetical protein
MNHKNNLAKFGYRPDMKVIKNNNPCIFWLLAGTWLSNFCNNLDFIFFWCTWRAPYMAYFFFHLFTRAFQKTEHPLRQANVPFSELPCNFYFSFKNPSCPRPKKL